jgi:hypothetical protein
MPRSRNRWAENVTPDARNLMRFAPYREPTPDFVAARAELLFGG